MKFNEFNLETWNRADHYEHFFVHVKCGFSVTKNIDITELLKRTKERQISFYPTLLYMSCRAVNNQLELRTSLNDLGQPGYWDFLNPSYTIFHKDTNTFSELWTKYSKDFSVFYKNYETDMKNYGDSHEFSPKKDIPKNCLPISSLPWTNFSGFNINMFENLAFLLPIITFGKYFEENASIQIPVSIQIHHASADGYHVSKFLNDLQELSFTAKDWLK